MKTNSTSIARVVALLLALVMTIGLAACGNGTASNDTSTIIDPETGTVTEIPSPNAGGKSWLDWGGWGKGNSNNSDDKSSNTTKTDSHVPGTPRESKPFSTNIRRVILNSYADGKMTTLTMSTKTPSKPDTKNTKVDNQYGIVDWSTAANGYITFTAKSQVREFILEGPNSSTALFEVAKNTSIKVALTDGTGKYQYAIANKIAGSSNYSIQYKNSFQVKSIDSDLAPYLTSTPYGDYENAPNAVAKADELWDTNKDRLANIEAIASWVGKLDYDKNLKMGTLGIYVNPDKVIENGGGVCNEMAKTLVAMLRSQGVPAYLQCGTNARGGSHGWVMAWLEYSSETKDGTTKSTGTWIAIESIDGHTQTKKQADSNYTPSEYRG